MVMFKGSVWYGPVWFGPMSYGLVWLGKVIFIFIFISSMARCG